MKMKPGTPLLPLFGALAAFGFAASTAHAATTIFSHTFNEGVGGLNGTPVDGGTLAPQNWMAASVVNANGAFATTAGSATLAFTPSNGFEYQLDARVLNITGNGNWVALGFANLQSAATGPNNRFITTGVVGTAWMLARGDNSANANTTFLGSGASSPTNQGLLNPVNWPTLNDNGGSIDLRILLDTTGGDGNWTATWLAKPTVDTGYTELRASTAVPLAHQAGYTSVGFAFASGGVGVLQGTLDSFSLTQIPEPSATLLGGLGLLALLRRRRH